MHECSNHIQHEVEAQGLYVVTHECIIPYSTCRGVSNEEAGYKRAAPRAEAMFKMHMANMAA